MQYTLCMYANISIYIYCKVFVKTGLPKTIGFQQSTCPVLDDSGTPIKKKINMVHQSICQECFVWTGVQELLSDSL